MRRIDLDDMIPSINSNIEYVSCKPGDTKGTLQYKTEKDSSPITVMVNWENPSKSEIEALFELDILIRKLNA